VGEETVKIEVPAGHKQGMPVPKGGSSCASCKYLEPGLECSNEYFQKWNGSAKIPTKDASSYCSDYWEPRSGRRTAGETLKAQRDKK
jgi:hypothetical protein